MKQAVGFPCGVCGRTILVLADGTWCPACKQVYHVDCLRAAATGRCPACGEDWVDPQAHFVYADFCPLCSEPNPDRLEHCPGCRQITCCEDRMEFGAAWERLMDAATGSRVGGVNRIAGGSLLLGLAIVGALVVANVGGLYWFAAPAVGFYLVGDGIRRLSRGRRLARFCRHHADRTRPAGVGAAGADGTP